MPGTFIFSKGWMSIWREHCLLRRRGKSYQPLLISIFQIRLPSPVLICLHALSSVDLSKCLRYSATFTTIGERHSRLENWSVLTEEGIASGWATQRNWQTEWMSEIIWRGITLVLQPRDFAASQWELLLYDALHSVRTLLSTAIYPTRVALLL